jgi:hypothetical protein
MCKNNLASLLSNPAIEFLIITLKICWNPSSSTWIFHAHWINLRILPLSKVNCDPFTSSISSIPKLYTSHFGDTCLCFDYGKIFGAIYLIDHGVEVEANVIF